MEFRVNLGGKLPDAAKLAAMLAAEDPAASGEIDGATGIWRVNTSLAARDLAALLGRAGCPTPLSQVSSLPSVCCGGCSG